MSSFPESLLDDLRNTRLALIAETVCDFKAQMLDLMKLREQVRKAERTDSPPPIRFPYSTRRCVRRSSPTRTLPIRLLKCRDAKRPLHP